MSSFSAVVKRNIKLFFKDKGMFFTSLITPAILLILYSAFLGDIYRSGFTAGLSLSQDIADGLVCGQIISSILSVSCVTVAFCTNFLMVQDKTAGVAGDFDVSPVKPSVISFAYYVSSFASTLIVCFSAAGLCFVYAAFAGWYMSVSDVLLILADIVLLSLFGTAISSIINCFLSTQGQISAVGTIVSAGYGFICGAYMPIASLSGWLQKLISFLPGTYGTALMRNHAMNGVLKEISDRGLPSEAVEQIKNSVDCNLYFFDAQVSVSAMYAVLCAATAILIAVYIGINAIRKKDKRFKIVCKKQP